MFLRNIKIKVKLIIAFALILTTCFSIVTIGIISLKKIDRLDTELYEINTKPIEKISQVSTAFQTKRVLVRDTILENNIENKKKLVDNIVVLDNAIPQYLSEFEKTIQSKEIKDIYESLLKSIEDYKPAQNNIIALALKNDSALALEAMKENLNIAQAIEKSINNLQEIKLSQAKEKSDSNSHTAEKSMQTLISLLVVGMIICLGSAIYIIISISKTSKQLAGYTAKVSSGDLSAELTIKSKDEFGLIALSFNETISKFKSTVKNILEKSKVVEGSASSVKSSISEIAAASTETAQTISEISKAIQSIASNVEQVSIDAKDTNDAASKGNKELAAVEHQMQKISVSIESINESTRALKGNLDSVSNIVDLITGIADQTNLLSLNAAIEAAKAGTAGNGFAVVAREIKNLALRSADGAKEIKSLIKAISCQSSQAVESVRQGNIEIEEGNKVIARASLEFKNIITSVQSLNDKVQDAASAIQEITAGVETVASAAQQQTASIEEISSISESLYNLSKELSETVSVFKI